MRRSSEAANPAQRELAFQPYRVEQQYCKDLWCYREMSAAQAWRYIVVRYEQNFIVLTWDLILPFLTMVVLTAVSGKLAKLPANGDAPYAVLMFATTFPWQFFSTAMKSCSDSLIINSNLLIKVYFTRVIVPAAAAIIWCVDFIISLARHARPTAGVFRALLPASLGSFSS